MLAGSLAGVGAMLLRMHCHPKFGIRVLRLGVEGWWLWGELGGAMAVPGLCSVLAASCSLECTAGGVEGRKEEGAVPKPSFEMKLG